MHGIYVCPSCHTLKLRRTELEHGPLICFFKCCFLYPKDLDGQTLRVLRVQTPVFGGFEIRQCRDQDLLGTTHGYFYVFFVQSCPSHVFSRI